MKIYAFILITILLSSCSGSGAPQPEPLKDYKSRTSKLDRNLIRVGQISPVHFPYKPGKSENIKITINPYNSYKSLINAFSEYEIDIMVMPLADFVYEYNKISEYRPEVFMLAGFSKGDEVLLLNTNRDNNEEILIHSVPGVSPYYMAEYFLKNTFEISDKPVKFTENSSKTEIYAFDTIHTSLSKSRPAISTEHLSRFSPRILICRSYTAADRSAEISEFADYIFKQSYDLLNDSNDIDFEPATLEMNKIFFSSNASKLNFYSLFQVTGNFGWKPAFHGSALSPELTFNRRILENLDTSERKKIEASLNQNNKSNDFRMKQAKLFSIRIPFDDNSAEMNRHNDTALNKIIFAAEAAPESALRISCRLSGSENWNSYIIQKRISMIISKLRAEGVSPSRIIQDDNEMSEVKKDSIPTELKSSIVVHFVL